MRTRVKICGITNVEDAIGVVESGADAIGLVFYPPSPRAVTIEQAVAIVKKIPAFITVVALFVNAEQKEVQSVIEAVKVDLLQFHGDETPDYCGSFNRPFIKALRVQPQTNLLQYATDFSMSKGLLLDAFSEGLPGGTGKVFDWTLIPQQFPLPIILAGGLDATNVLAAIEQVKPFAVDVSGGVELSKGKKDAFKLRAFMQQVNQSGVE